MITTDKIKSEAEVSLRANQTVVKKLSRSKPKDLDRVTHKLHDEAFEQINCLECANCCKTTSPIIREGDVSRMSKALKMKEAQFISAYLVKDEDQDYVFNQAPCPFLDNQNYCIIYKDRPTACKEYPHTNRKRFAQILQLSLKNTEVCPAVQYVFEKLREKYL